ncbi:MAG: MarR family transcriptional regulator [Gammaproteobacteria bacterium]|nr:MarR family transcriptional regulator [Gammaproteobacteria bacterium]
MSKNLELRKLLTYQLVALSREISYFNQRSVNPTKDLNIPEMRILGLLHTLGRSNQKEFIKNSLRGDPGNISRYIKGLEKKGYLKSVKDKVDKRIKWLSPTAKGRKAAEKYIQQRYFHNNELTAEFTKAELVQFEKFIKKTALFYENKQGR